MTEMWRGGRQAGKIREQFRSAAPDGLPTKDMIYCWMDDGWKVQAVIWKTSGEVYSIPKEMPAEIIFDELKARI